MNNYSTAVLGASGYAGRELCAILARHPHARVRVAAARGAGVLRVPGADPLELTALDDVSLAGCDVVFSCLPHGESAAWLERAPSDALLIDLSADLRPGHAGAHPLAARATYGLTELARGDVRGAQVVANPGCYPTAALLGLAPVLRRGMVAGPVVIHAASGVTGAGRSPKAELLYGEVAEDYRAYGVGNEHRHLGEIRATASALAGVPLDVVFTPHLLPVRRGILETIHVPLAQPLDTAAARELWRDDYASEPFIALYDDEVPSLRDVVGTNRVAIHVRRVSNVDAPALQLIVAIDNLVKGAAGQAVQNMNVALGVAETEGLAWAA
ncbi:MAG TPA: N-acetyl-gamma-glutamyl-phosphate reductase [Longimicrobiales bacterium]